VKSSSFYRIDSTDIRVSLKDLAAILQILSFVMLMPLAATVYYSQQPELMGRVFETATFVIPSLILYGLYQLSRRLGVAAPPKTKSIMITVALAWLIMALVGSIPFMMRDVLSPTDAFFESMSGFTTTGFSMIQDIESTPKDILLFRGIMQGVGGLGVISLWMMVIMQGSSLGVGYADVGIQKIKPGIRHTILESWKIYGLYILLGVAALYIFEMSFFDALNHSITAVATGGFTTHESIGYFDSVAIEIILLVLMSLGSISFILHYRLFSGDRNVFRSDELKYMFLIIVAATALVSLAIWGRDIPGVDTYSMADVIRKSSFHVVSGMSTCGFATVDFGQWPESTKTIMVGLMYIGGMSSSTAGGIRVIRFLILLKVIHYCLKRLVLPKSAIVLMKIDGKAMKNTLITVVGYSAVYLLMCMVLSMGLMLIGYSTVDSIGTIMSAMGNDGLGFITGDQWYNMSAFGKLNVIFAMWIGRIEIYPGLLILRSLLNKLRIM
jgi:trk system potassium uptake protein TrkH